MNTMELRGQWDTLKGRVKQHWGQLTDDDLQWASGGIDQVLGKIERRTGETRANVESFLRELMDGGETVTAKAQRVAQRAGDAVQRAGETVSDTYQQASDEIRRHAEEGYEMAERYVRDNPAQSMGMVFGFGVLAGLGLAALLRSSR